MKHLQTFTPIFTQEIVYIFNYLNVFYADRGDTKHAQKERIVAPKQRHKRNKHHKGLHS